MALRLLALSAFFALVAAACGTTSDDGSAGNGGSTACDNAFAHAAAVGEMQDAVEDLYPAVRACTSMDEWVAASEANPGAISDGVDPLVFLGNVCGSLTAGLENTDLCQQAKAACDTNESLANSLVCLPE